MNNLVPESDIFLIYLLMCAFRGYFLGAVDPNAIFLI
jgi:hypothetical protein